MQKQNADINSLLSSKINLLSPEGLSKVRASFANSPLMLQLLDYVRSSGKESFKTADAVKRLYAVKQDDAAYTTFENRFFKLRKKCYNHFTETPPEIHPVFTAQEIQLQEIKTLSVEGKHQELLPLVRSLEQQLWNENIFELLPEVLEIYIHTNQILKRFDDNKVLYEKTDQLELLFSDSIQAKKIARRIYEVNVLEGATAIVPYLHKLQRLAIKHKQYPRFRLIYNVVAAVHKLGGGGLQHRHDPKVANRFLTVIKRIHQQHPSMPDYKFSSGYAENQNYLFRTLEIMNHFNAFQFREAAKQGSALYQLVMAQGSNMKRMRGPVFFSSTCLVQIAGGEFQQALQTANEYLKYLKENREDAQLLNAYAEIVEAHLWLHPVSGGMPASFIEEKLNELIKSNRQNHPYLLAQIWWKKVRWLMVNKKYSEAEKVFLQNEVSNCFIEKRITGVALSSLQLLQKNDVEAKAVNDQISAVRVVKFNCIVPPDYLYCEFLERMLKRKLAGKA